MKEKKKVGVLYGSLCLGDSIVGADECWTLVKKTFREGRTTPHELIWLRHGTGKLETTWFDFPEVVPAGHVIVRG